MTRPRSTPRRRRSVGATPLPGLVAAPRAAVRAGTLVAAGALGLFVVVAGVVLRTDGRDRWDVVLRGDLLRTDARAPAGLAHAAVALGAPAVLVVVALLAAVLLWRWARRPLLGAGVVLVCVATAALVQLLALALSGVRPVPWELLGVPLFDGSFPSVRTAAAEALWGALAGVGLLLAPPGPRRLACGALGVALSAAVAWGQLDRAHAWPTDVLGGWLLGLAAAGAAAALLSTWPVLPPGPPAAPEPAGALAGRSDPARTTLGS